jgi:hypothetical protein
VRDTKAISEVSFATQTRDEQTGDRRGRSEQAAHGTNRTRSEVCFFSGINVLLRTRVADTTMKRYSDH